MPSSARPSMEEEIAIGREPDIEAIRKDRRELEAEIRSAFDRIGRPGMNPRIARAREAAAQRSGQTCDQGNAKNRNGSRMTETGRQAAQARIVRELTPEEGRPLRADKMVSNAMHIALRQLLETPIPHQYSLAAFDPARMSRHRLFELPLPPLSDHAEVFRLAAKQYEALLPVRASRIAEIRREAQRVLEGTILEGPEPVDSRSSVISGDPDQVVLARLFDAMAEHASQLRQIHGDVEVYDRRYREIIVQVFEALTQAVPGAQGIELTLIDTDREHHFVPFSIPVPYGSNGEITKGQAYDARRVLRVLATIEQMAPVRPSSCETLAADIEIPGNVTLTREEHREADSRLEVLRAKEKLRAELGQIHDKITGLSDEVRRAMRLFTECSIALPCERPGGSASAKRVELADELRETLPGVDFEGLSNLAAYSLDGEGLWAMEALVEDIRKAIEAPRHHGRRHPVLRNSFR